MPMLWVTLLLRDACVAFCCSFSDDGSMVGVRWTVGGRCGVCGQGGGGVSTVERPGRVDVDDGGDKESDGRQRRWIAGRRDNGTMVRLV
ncbi:hypothetical protein C8F04DRAFT_597808 [Mycena alexandri]|uniref:Secreted protein n=1 Tax=Mycena alexandri TaxID=1745969 RepID=A0AAD6TJ71_9AGAR|nr:hypothetical protein C8F04DRAFT_597808 [Mycena alexandri]